MGAAGRKDCSLSPDQKWLCLALIADTLLLLHILRVEEDKDDEEEGKFKEKDQHSSEVPQPSMPTPRTEGRSRRRRPFPSGPSPRPVPNGIALLVFCPFPFTVWCGRLAGGRVRFTSLS